MMREDFVIVYNLLSVSSLRRICCPTFYSLCDKRLAVNYACSSYKRWIFCSRISAIRHRCVRFLLLHYIVIYKIKKTSVVWFGAVTIFLPPLIADYLLSNNHVNSIIEHKFDFSDEEVSDKLVMIYVTF